MVRQAREWESSGEYARAVECYLKVTTNLTDDRNVLERCWMKVQKDTYTKLWKFVLYIYIWYRSG